MLQVFSSIFFAFTLSFASSSSGFLDVNKGIWVPSYLGQKLSILFLSLPQALLSSLVGNCAALVFNFYLGNRNGVIEKLPIQL